MLAFAQQGPTTDYFPGRYRRSRTKGAKSQSPMAFHRHPPQSRTPDVVEFAVSPQVGQAVLACPTCEALAIERNGSAHFPRHAEIAGRHQEF